MNTNAASRIFFLIFLIAIASTFLSACSGDGARDVVRLAASAGYSENNPATVQALQINSRVSACDLSSKQRMINELKSLDSDATIGAWLDSKLDTYTCIAR